MIAVCHLYGASAGFAVSGDRSLRRMHQFPSPVDHPPSAFRLPDSLQALHHGGPTVRGTAAHAFDEATHEPPRRRNYLTSPYSSKPRLARNALALRPHDGPLSTQCISTWRKGQGLCAKPKPIQCSKLIQRSSRGQNLLLQGRITLCRLDHLAVVIDRQSFLDDRRNHSAICSVSRIPVASPSSSRITGAQDRSASLTSVRRSRISAFTTPRTVRGSSPGHPTECAPAHPAGSRSASSRPCPAR
jgi:hypothetical protein